MFIETDNPNLYFLSVPNAFDGMLLTAINGDKLLEFILEAMPLILFKRQLPDGRRIYDEIFEGLKIEKGVFFVEYL